MPLLLSMLLYLGAAAALLTAGGVGMAALFAPAQQQAGKIAPNKPAPRPAVAAAAAADTEAPSASRSPAWIAATPKYDMPAPGVAARAVADAKKAEAKRSSGAAKRRIARELRRDDDAPGLAYGFAERPRFTPFSRDIQ